MQDSPLAALVAKAVNRLLRSDPDVAARVGAMRGKVIAVHVTTFDQVLYFLPRDDSVTVVSEYEREPDTWVRGGAVDLFKLSFAGRGASSRRVAARAEISGDVALGQEFQQVFKDLEFDWEELPAAWFGDACAHELGRGARAAAAWLGRSLDSLADSGGEYLREEMRATPDARELREFIERVDELRDALERLEARERALRGGRRKGADGEAPMET